MSKFFRSLAVMTGFVAMFAASIGTAQAQTSTFQVAVTLTPGCRVNMNTTTFVNQATTNIALPYTAFQTGNSDASTGFDVRCSNTLPYSIGISPDTNTAAGITYFLNVVAGTTASYTGTTGGGALGSLTGNGAAQAYTVGARALPGQAGTCAVTAGCTVNSSNHTITVTY